MHEFIESLFSFYCTITDKLLLKIWTSR